MPEPAIRKDGVSRSAFSLLKEAKKLPFRLRKGSPFNYAATPASAEYELKGELKGKLEVATKMMAKGMDMESFSDFTGFPRYF